MKPLLAALVVGSLMLNVVLVLTVLSLQRHRDHLITEMRAFDQVTGDIERAAVAIWNVHGRAAIDSALRQRHEVVRWNESSGGASVTTESFRMDFYRDSLIGISTLRPIDTRLPAQEGPR